MGLAVLLFNFMAGVPLQRVPGYAQSIGQKPAKHPAISGQELLGCPQQHPKPSGMSGKRGRMCSPREKQSQKREAPAPPEDAFVILPKKLMFLYN
jgi:hypothetical protein